MDNSIVMLPYSLLEEIIRLDAEIDETSNDPEITFMRGYQKAHNDIWDMFCKVLKDDTLQKLDDTYGLEEEYSRLYIEAQKKKKKRDAEHLMHELQAITKKRNEILAYLEMGDE